ncbi:Protein prenyltransferase alpha subunit repeat-containing protein 1 [Lamellibrachia satsuma]|nr:Protein prenyltransferase alpha subunit repeat-containing protein 1 [Lamellibrachia satsuma]
MDDLGAKILSNLNAAFSRDTDIDEYDFLPIDGPLQNKNPVIIAGHKVALELWAVKVLYLHAHSRLVGHAVKEVGRKVLGAEEIISLSRAALLVNADFMSAWNKRRELILQAQLSIDQDLKLTELILRKHPKKP